MPKPVKVVAFDIALAKSGWAALTSDSAYEAGSWQTPSSAPIEQRLHLIADMVSGLVVQFAPTLVVIEGTLSSARVMARTSMATIAALDQARGAAVGAASLYVPVVRFMPPETWKYLMLGDEVASKDLGLGTLAVEGLSVPLTDNGKPDLDAVDAIWIGRAALRCWLDGEFILPQTPRQDARTTRRALMRRGVKPLF